MCGNVFNGQPVAVDICACNNPCPGNPAEMCGGKPAYLSLYDLSKSFLMLKTKLGIRFLYPRGCHRQGISPTYPLQGISPRISSYGIFANTRTDIRVY